MSYMELLYMKCHVEALVRVCLFYLHLWCLLLNCILIKKVQMQTT